MSKYSYTILCLFIFPFFIQAQGIEFFEGSWDEALQKSKEEDKPIFLDAYASWCGPCKRMARDVFTDPRVGDYFNERFINLQIDMERDIGPELAAKYRVGAFPTLLFLSHDSEVIHRMVGALDVNRFIQLGAEAYSKYDVNAEYRTAYKEGRRDYKTIHGYLLSLRKSNESTIKVANEFLQTDPFLNEEQRMELAFAAASDADSKFFDEAISHKKELIKLHGQDKYEEWMMQAVMNTVKKAIEFQYEPLMKESIDKIGEFAGKNTKLQTAKAEMFYHGMMKNNQLYLKAAQNYFAETKSASLKEHMTLARQMLRYFNNKETNTVAIEIIEKSWKPSDDSADLLSAAQICVQCYAFDLAQKILKAAEKNNPKLADDEHFRVLQKKSGSDRDKG